VDFEVAWFFGNHNIDDLLPSGERITVEKAVVNHIKMCLDEGVAIGFDGFGFVGVVAEVGGFLADGFVVT
jgi:hypothetical protein